ncbi:MAG: MBL fold metallo-hydrolase [Chitinophagales bacterium]
MATITYRSNPDLPFILDGWKGNPHNGLRFFDPQHRFEQKFSNILRWQLTANPQKAEKKNSTWKLQTITDKKFLSASGNSITWLGHASFLIQFNGVKLLIDPVLYRISGVVKRHSELPCAATDLKPDYVLLSHFHRDHCDERSLRDVYSARQFQMITSLGGNDLVKRWLPGVQLTEMGWYQQLELPAGITITHLPTQHWSNRFPWDTNQTLWGSYMISCGETNIFFGGDSGYCDYPKQIAGLFPKIDYAMIGVGAYTPSYIMQAVHTSPQEAVQVVSDLKATCFLPMHYGTFDLADEPLHEPEQLLREMEKKKMIGARLQILKPGELLLF